MKNILVLILLFTNTIPYTFASGTLSEPVVAPGTVSATSATLVWDKPEQYAGIVGYHIVLNGKDIGVSAKCNYMLSGLQPLTTYTCVVRAQGKDGNLSASSPG